VTINHYYLPNTISFPLFIITRDRLSGSCTIFPYSNKPVRRYLTKWHDLSIKLIEKSFFANTNRTSNKIVQISLFPMIITYCSTSSSCELVKWDSL
jgi:hypothetical protein